MNGVTVTLLIEEAGAVKVFISWSGEKSRRVAEILRDWLPDVVNAVEPWMSSEDIDKGAAGLPEIAAQLKDCTFGIVCLTRENQDSAWVNFESGALSKSVGDDPTRVATLLIDIDRPSEVTGPLAQFQATQLAIEDMTRLALALDKAASGGRTPDRISGVVTALWPNLQRRIEESLAEVAAPSPVKPRRQERDLLEEVLELTREVASTVQVLNRRTKAAAASGVSADAERFARHDRGIEFDSNRMRAEKGLKDAIRKRYPKSDPTIEWLDQDYVRVLLHEIVGDDALLQLLDQLHGMYDLRVVVDEMPF